MSVNTDGCFYKYRPCLMSPLPYSDLIQRPVKTEYFLINLEFCGWVEYIERIVRHIQCILSFSSVIILF